MADRFKDAKWYIPHARGGEPVTRMSVHRTMPYSPRMWGWTIELTAIGDGGQGMVYHARNSVGLSQSVNPRYGGIYKSIYVIN